MSSDEWAGLPETTDARLERVEAIELASRAQRYASYIADAQDTSYIQDLWCVAFELGRRAASEATGGEHGE